MSNQPFRLIFLSIILGILLHFFSGLTLWANIGLAFFIVLFIDFTQKTGNQLPIPEMIVFIAALQWIIGPIIDYHNGEEHYKYKMYITEDIYMGYVVPGVIALFAGIKLYSKELLISELKEKVTIFFGNYPRLPYWLVILGISAPFLSGYFPAALGFVFFLIGNFKYIGALYFILSGHKNRWLIFSGLMVASIVASIVSGMFHNFLLWGILTMSFIFHELKFSFKQKLLIMMAGGIMVVTMQAVKFPYREQSPNYASTSQKVGFYFSLVRESWKGGKFINPVDDNDINVRINQGWIISAIMENIPEKRPYDGGQSVMEAIESAVVPRVFNPGKKQASGRDNFVRYTGLDINQTTSMGISLAGEGWANYGYGGGILFLFLWGLFINLLWRKLNNLSKYYPTILVWTPIIFLQVVKAESELLTVLNHLIKSSVLVLGFLWYLRRFHNISI